MNDLSSLSFSSPQRGNTTNNNSTVNNDSICLSTSNIQGWSKCPDFWSDDVRMNALFTAFRNRDLNPLHYDNKMRFWKDLITCFCRDKQIIQFDLAQIEACFCRKNAKPKCLELVLGELVRERALIKRDEFLRPQVGLVQTVFNKLVWSPLAWSSGYIMRPIQSTSSLFIKPKQSPTTPVIASPSQPVSDSLASPKRLGLTTTTNVSNDSSYFVLPDLVENKARELIHMLNEKHVVHRNVDCVLDYEELVSVIKIDEYDEEEERPTLLNDQTDLDLILRYLKANEKILITDSLLENRKLVKFTLGYAQKCEPITQIEVCYLRLKDLERKLENEVNSLSRQIESVLESQVKVNMRQNNKLMALRHLKKKKQIEKSLESKEAALSNIQAMIQNIQQADTNKVTLDVYNESASALKEANKGLDLDQIDNTIEQLQDAFAVNAEIEEALRSPIGNRYGPADAELALELENLLAETETTCSKSSEPQQQAFNMDTLLDSLPNIPSSIKAAKKPLTETASKT